MDTEIIGGEWGVIQVSVKLSSMINYERKLLLGEDSVDACGHYETGTLWVL